MQTNRHHDVRVARQGLDLRLAFAVFAAATLGVAGFLIAGTAAQGAVHSNATVSLKSTKLGPILVNSKGHTLYLFVKDKNGTSSCKGSCTTYWPPDVVKAEPTAGRGVKAPLLGTTRRGDGRLQVTYKHHPLYTYVGDTKAGQVNGQGSTGSGAKWWVVSATGAAVTKAAAAASTTTSTGGTTTTSPTTTTGGYGYPQ